VLTREVPAAAEVAAPKAAAEMTATELAAAEAAHVAEVSAGEMTGTELAAAELAAAEAAHVAVSAGELAAAEAAHVAEVSAGEMSPVAVESEATVEAVVEAVVKAVVEATASDEDRTSKPVAIVVIRIGVAVTIVVAGAIIRPIVVIGAVRIAGRDSRAGIIAIAVHVTMSVSPNIMAMACVSVCNAPVQTARDARVSGVPGVVGDGRRVCGRKRRREDKSGRAERDSRNSKSAKSHGNLPFMLGGAAGAAGTPPYVSDRSALLIRKIPVGHECVRLEIAIVFGGEESRDDRLTLTLTSCFRLEPP
jgi:hypothetical protein